MSTPNSHKKALTAADVTLYTVSAILLVDQIAMSAAVGEAAIFWWLVVIGLFLIPNTLVTAELGTAYPEQGGIYAWVRDAFNTRWAARITWLYWVNIALWMPAVFIMFSGIFAALFMPEMSLWGQIGLGVAMCWLTTWANCIRLEYSKWIPNLGTPIKFVVILTLAGAGIGYGLEHGFANDISLSSALNDWQAGLAYLPVIVYGCLGLELISAESDEIRNPKRDVPRAMIAAGLISATLYIFGTAGVLAAVPAEQIDMIDILATTLKELFGGTELGNLFALVIGGLTLFTLYSTMVTWTLGGNRAVAEAADAREMPAVFGWSHRKHQTPVGAAIMTSLVSSTIMVLYGLMAHSAEELFWTLFSFSAIVFLLPYIGMHCAFMKLRFSDPQQPRPFRIPGGNAVGMVLSVQCIAILLLAILLFFWVPGEPLDLMVLAQVGGGVLITLIIGEYLVHRGEKLKGDNRAKESPNKAKPAADPLRA
ncbi:APC family permease [Marinobacterium arenosum]|uniref:APC family permease n=1 Tax=Marinobacterium arenosum TaxID=2862496 RepID=UPI001C9572CB|nr:APC family permease [Marinobacterium arenosum]MBY4678167.1 APC family permease [Marinobacterium arenosum]